MFDRNKNCIYPLHEEKYEDAKLSFQTQDCLWLYENKEGGSRKVVRNNVGAGKKPFSLPAILRSLAP